MHFASTPGYDGQMAAYICCMARLTWQKRYAMAQLLALLALGIPGSTAPPKAVPPPLRVVGSGAGIFPGSAGACGQPAGCWMWNPETVSSANAAAHGLFDSWGRGCPGGSCGAAWNCSEALQPGCSDTLGPASVGEWGYEFHNFSPQAGQPGQPPCFNLTSAAYHHRPSNKTEALARLQAYFTCRQRVAASRPGGVGPGFDALNGHYFYFHQAVAFGASAGGTPVSRVTSEVCENINSINAHLAFLRGAARQYGIEFAVDVSPWFQGLVPDYANVSGPWAGHSSRAGATGGHSVSLLQRTYSAVAAAGATELIVESGDCYAFRPSADPASGALDLSPIGSALAEVGEDRSRGEPFTPLAVLFEHAHGMGLGWWYQSRSWETQASGGFPLTAAQQSATLLFEWLWPGSWQTQWKQSDSWREEGNRTEQGYMVAGPIGDLVDVLSPRNLSTLAQMARYKAIVLAGDVEIDQEIACAGLLSRYVRAGGIVVMLAERVNHSQALRALLTEAGLSLKSHVRQITASAARSLDDSWEVPAANVTAAAPFCSPIFGQSGVVWTGRFYIKTGGVRSKRRGWDGGVLDKCCRDGAGNCFEFATADVCQTALMHQNCSQCDDEGVGVGCPTWADGAAVAIASVTGATTTLSEFVAADSSTVPAVVTAALGTGSLTLILASDTPTLEGFQLLARTLQPLADSLTPFELLDAATRRVDLRGRVQLMLNRWPDDGATFNVTLINNEGVTKTPSEAADQEPTSAVSVVLRATLGRRIVHLSCRGRGAALGGDGAVHVTLPPGGVVAMSVLTASAGAKMT